MNRLNGTMPLARYEIKSGETLLAGELAAIQSDGKVLRASDTAGLTVIGAVKDVRDGFAELEDGVLAFANDSVAANALARQQRGKPVYVKDQGTVSASRGSHGVTAGICVDVYEGEVYVDLTAGALAQAAAWHLATAGYAPEALEVEADPEAAAASNKGQIILVKTAWTGGTVIAAGTVGDVYISTGSAWVKLN